MKNVKVPFYALLFIFLSVYSALGERKIISLNGTWDLAKGSDATIPTTYNASVPVPGLVDLASGNVGSGSWWWYRKAFALSETPQQVALIKFHKAKYGAKVYLNGTLVGEHLPCFTAGYLNIRPYLNFTGENTLIVRVGDKTSLPKHVFDASDFEKKTFYPGIYDDVELIFCNSPRVVTIQTAATLNNTVQIIADLKNETGTSHTGTVNFSVARVDNGTVVGSGQADITIGANASIQKTVTIAITNAEYWTPETPFLYELTTTTAGDIRKDRFGMRTFRFAPPDYWPELNGNTYMMRGTNVAPLRFEDDPEHKLLWDTAWVRKLIQNFKYMNFNSMRTTIGFLPDFWYDILDQEGFMVQDEFPIWGWAYSSGVFNSGKTVEELVLEGKEWMYERCNHPSLYCWDMANETGMNANDGEVLTGPAIDELRKLDIQNLPWDNSYGPRRKDGDICEVHPYLFDPGKMWNLKKLNTFSDDPLVVGAQNSQFKPAVNNEFEWIWINRDNSSTEGSESFFKFMVDYRLYGKPALGTGKDRRHIYDLYLPAIMEFWRVGRKCQVIHHFCGLTSSLVNKVGFTSDNFLAPLSELKMSDEFSRYYRYANAPVCICIARYDDEYVANSQESIKVKIANDTRTTSWTKIVTLKTTRVDDTTTITKVTRQFIVNALDTLSQLLSITMPPLPGKYFLIAEYNDGNENIQSVREFDNLPDIPISINKAVTASSTSGTNTPQNAADHEYKTRWQANGKAIEWIQIDLGSVQQIGRIKLLWEAAYASVYSIKISDNGTNWTTLQSITNGTGGFYEIKKIAKSGRYVRIECTTPGTAYNYSLIEFQVFGAEVVAIEKETISTNQNEQDISISTRYSGSQMQLLYQVPQEMIARIRLQVFTVDGSLLKSYENEDLPRNKNGSGSVVLSNDGKTRWKVTPGIYICRLQCGKKAYMIKTIPLY